MSAYVHVCLLGVDMSSMHQMKTQRSSTMLSDVKQLVSSGGSVNQHNDDGVSLVSPALLQSFISLECNPTGAGGDLMDCGQIIHVPCMFVFVFLAAHCLCQRL